jgi:hypothetical protein
MRIVARGAALTSLLMLVAGCNTLTSPARLRPFEKDGMYFMDYNAERRGAILYVGPELAANRTIKYCAEPAPDTSADFDTQLSVSKEAIAEGSLGMGQATVILPGRNSTVLALRESLYRLCELSINRPGINDKDLMEAYSELVTAVTRVSEAVAEKESAQAAQAQAVATAVADASIPIAAVRSNTSSAREAENEGFQALLDGNFADALTSFTQAEALSPGRHNAYEISRYLKNALADGDVSDTERAVLYRNLGRGGTWSWGTTREQQEAFDRLAE